MSLNRLKYDVCEQKQYMRETIAPGDYFLNQPVICGTCYQDNPSIKLQKSGVSLDGSKDWRFYNGPVDVESELLNITRSASRCPSEKYIPTCVNCGCLHQEKPGSSISSSMCDKCKNKSPNGKACGDKNLFDFPVCHFPVDNTRLMNKSQRCQNVNRFEYPLYNPQTNVFFPGKTISSRMVIKDMYSKYNKK